MVYGVILPPEFIEWLQHFGSYGKGRRASSGILSALPTKMKQSMGYRQLTQAERYQIFAHRDLGLSQRQLAQQLGIHSSTVSREMRRRDINPHKRSVAAIRNAAPPGSGQSNSLA